MQTAVAKEGLRMFPGTIAHPRVVPRDGAVIAGEFIPGGVRINYLYPSILDFLIDVSFASVDGCRTEFQLCASVTTHVRASGGVFARPMARPKCSGM